MSEHLYSALGIISRNL